MSVKCWFDFGKKLSMIQPPARKLRLWTSILQACMLIFVSERVINVWNSLTDDVVNFDSFYKFKCSMKRADYSHYLRFCH